MPNYDGPVFFHQLGDMDHKRCLEMLQSGHGDGVIISPHDFSSRESWSEDLLDTYAQKFKVTNKTILVDPQGYDPVKVGERINSPVADTAGLLDRNINALFIHQSLELQEKLGATQFLVPSTYSQPIDDIWLDVLASSCDIASQWVKNLQEPKPLLATIAIHTTEVTSQQQRRKLLNNIVTLPVHGFYLVVADVDPSTRDIPFLTGFLELVFRLKWQGFKVISGYSGPWAMLAFPFGLDGFANSGRKNRQSFKPLDWRGEKPKGGGPKNFYDVWSPVLLSYIRYPGDAEFLKNQNLWKRLERSSPYAPPFDRAPAEVYESKAWEQGTSFKFFSWEMWALAKEFQNLGRVDRIERVRHKLALAQNECDAVKHALSQPAGAHISAWRDAFEKYLDSVTDDLEALFT